MDISEKYWYRDGPYELPRPELRGCVFLLVPVTPAGHRCPQHTFIIPDATVVLTDTLCDYSSRVNYYLF